MTLGEPFPAGDKPRPVDAVIHFAGISKPMLVSDGETFRVNVMGTHNVIEAACKLGIKKVIIASSITVYGVAFGQGGSRVSEFSGHGGDRDESDGSICSIETVRRESGEELC